MMKKSLLLILLLPLLTGCSNVSDQIALEGKISDLELKAAQQQGVINELESKKQQLLETNANLTKENAGQKIDYILEVSVRQRHLSLSISQQIKDAANEFNFNIPVTREFYDSVNVGDDLGKNFRWGSLLADGNIGDWRVKVENKFTK